MKFSKYLFSAVLAVIIFLASASEIYAQRNVSYRELAMKNQQQPLFFDFVVLPGETDSSVTFSSVFSLAYSYLPFKKSNSQGAEFISTASLNMEVFKSKKSNLESNNISIEGLEPAARDYWSGTALAESYEQSQSKQELLSGHLNVSLQPGIYSYVVQLTGDESGNDRTSRAQTIRIKPYSETKVGQVLLGKQFSDDGEMPRFKLISMGNNVRYGNDFYVLAHIPGYESGSNYTLQINSLETAGEDTSKTGEVYVQKITASDVRTDIIPKFAGENGEGNVLNLTPSDHGYAYATAEIPGSTFPNSLYRLTVKKENQTVSQTTFRSIWIDMPASLLSLDVSIDMLHFIVDEKTLDRISSGSLSERKKKFREFWKERDPTPKTEFNELLAEYYRRIDYAYENFSTRNVPGYESDQGKIYIKFGPPQNVERRFPADGATTEIWEYQNRRFIFKATSGFGDFKLVSE